MLYLLLFSQVALLSKVNSDVFMNEKMVVKHLAEGYLQVKFR